MRELTTTSTVGKKNINRLEAVSCAACGRKVKRQSRQQRYCSDRCRKFASREKPTAK
jgi:predicted nucleic acid-binding Zn ribbon protein